MSVNPLSIGRHHPLDGVTNYKSKLLSFLTKMTLRHNDTQHNDNQHNNTQHNDTLHYGKCCFTECRVLFIVICQ